MKKNRRELVSFPSLLVLQQKFVYIRNCKQNTQHASSLKTECDYHSRGSKAHKTSPVPNCNLVLFFVSKHVIHSFPWQVNTCDPWFPPVLFFVSRHSVHSVPWDLNRSIYVQYIFVYCLTSLHTPVYLRGKHLVQHLYGSWSTTWYGKSQFWTCIQ